MSGSRLDTQGMHLGFRYSSLPSTAQLRRVVLLLLSNSAHNIVRRFILVFSLVWCFLFRFPMHVFSMRGLSLKGL